ncbi:hypothetical protein JVU11DRAFT_2603 [Chiua virens]|nr:hypothetical protein JVU11DRAFT_2603 [Chiua virens]
MAKHSRNTAKKPASASLARVERQVDDVDEEEYVSGSDDDTASLHSDALDEQSDDTGKRKRRRVLSSSASKRAPTSNRKSKRSGANKEKAPARKKRKVSEEASEDESESDVVQLRKGQEVVGKVVEAPTTGWAPEGQVSQHTLDFLSHMQDPTCNDRVWFRLHEPIYRRCEKEFKDFIEAFTTMLTEVDVQIPPLPPKDVIHRIYRDIRFSNDKTPYKTNFSASFSRSGRKGTFAFYYIMIKPGNESSLAAGAWCPAKNELNMIRNHIKHSSDRLREIISAPDFVAHFGEACPHPKGQRQNVFGAEDELKTAPKGVDRNHKDIDLLKCRSLAVFRTFSDEQVLAGTFIQELEQVARILRPFVHYLNDMITLPVGNDEDADE